MDGTAEINSPQGSTPTQIENRRFSLRDYFYIAIFWSLLSFSVLLVLVSLFPPLLAGYLNPELLTNQVLGEIRVYGWFLLFSVIPITFLVFLTAALKILAKPFLFLLILISILASPLIFFVLASKCEGLECLGSGLMLLVYVFVIFMSMAILPVALARIKIVEFSLKVFLQQSLKYGFVVLVAYSLVFATVVFPWRVGQLKEQRPQTEKYLEQSSEEKNQLAQLKASYNLLKPSYLPKNIDTKVLPSESIKDGGLETGYICYNNDGYHQGLFEIDQLPLNKGPKLAKADLTKEVNISSTKGTIYIYYALHDSANEVTERRIVWETADLQIVLGGNYPCVLDDNELVKIAESMQAK